MGKPWETLEWYGIRIILVGIVMMAIGGVLFLLGHWLTVTFWRGGAAVVLIGGCIISGGYSYYFRKRRGRYVGWDRSD